MIFFIILNSFKKEALGDVRLLISPKKKNPSRRHSPRRRRMPPPASNTSVGVGRSRAEPPSQPRRVCKPKPELAETAEADQPRVCKPKPELAETAEAGTRRASRNRNSPRRFDLRRTAEPRRAAPIKPKGAA